MPNEEVVVDQDQAEPTDQVQEETTSEDSFDDVVEPFGQADDADDESDDDSASEDSDEEVQDSDDDPAASGAEPETEDTPAVNPEVEALKKQNHDLNRALYQARQKKKEQDATPPAESALSESDIDKLLTEYRDDPVTMKQLIRHMAQQEARGVNKEIGNTQRASVLKQRNEEMVAKQWPELMTEGSQERKIVDSFKANYDLGSHPMADHLAASVAIAENLPNLQRQWFEAGKQEGLKGKTEQARKKSISSNSLTPPKPKPATPAPKSKASSSEQDVIARLGLSPSATKEFLKIKRSKQASTMEA